jgi:hypothetical protein
MHEGIEVKEVGWWEALTAYDMVAIVFSDEEPNICRQSRSVVKFNDNLIEGLSHW